MNDNIEKTETGTSTLLKKSLEKKAMAIIGEELIPANSVNFGERYCIKVKQLNPLDAAKQQLKLLKECEGQ